MSGEASLEIKPKCRRKVLVGDQGLDVVLVIPATMEGVEKEASAHASKEASTPAGGRVLELHLVEPSIHIPAEIKSNIDKSIVATIKAAPLNYVFPVPYNVQRYSEVTLLSAEREVHPSSTVVSDMIKGILGNMPSVRFEKCDSIGRYDVEKSIDIKVKTLIDAVNYVAIPRVVFYQLCKVKHVEVDAEVRVKTSERLSFMSAAGAASEGALVEDVLEHFFGASLSRAAIDRPFLILAEKPHEEKYSYIELLKRLLRELYRVYAGGLPRPFDLQTNFDEVNLDVRAGEHLYVIDADKALPPKIEGGVVKYIADRLRELCSQSFGFLIFYGSKEKLDSIENLKVENAWMRCTVIPSGTFYRIVKPIRMSLRKSRGIYNLTNIIWGKVEGFERVEEVVDLDLYAATLEGQFYGRIAELASDPNTIVRVEPSGGGEEGFEGETLLHYGIKALAVKHLVEHENVPESDISTEHSLGDIVVDVFAKHPEHGNLAIEVETLYGTTLPLLKLRRTIESRLSKGLKLWVVIPNPQFVLFLRDLGKLRSIYRRKYLDLVELFTLDVYSQKLIPFPEIVEGIKRLME